MQQPEPAQIDLRHLASTGNPLYFGEGAVQVTGKGNKTRIVPLGSHAIEAMQKWLQIRKNITLRDAASKRVFIGLQGRRISARSI